MPIIKKKPPELPERQEILDRLVEELRSPGDRGQPLILENPIGETDNFNVYVIWDRWAGLPHFLRSTVIVGAYMKFNGTGPNRIPIASGLTVSEAILEGLLPVRIEPVGRRDDHFPLEQLRAAMVDEGAIEAIGSLQLRFTSLEDAQAVFDRLQARFPASFRLVEEQPAWTN
jgi:hypothetical protein